MMWRPAPPVKAAYYHNGPIYLRFGRVGGSGIPRRRELHLYHWQGRNPCEGSDLTIIATGLWYMRAIQAADTAGSRRHTRACFELPT